MDDPDESKRDLMRIAPLLLTLLTLLTLHAAQAQPPVIPLKHAELVLSSSTTPPARDATDWRPVTLPDQWGAERYRNGETGSGWYRFELDAAPPQTLWGIYLPRLNMNAAVWFNGQLLGDGGSFAEPLGRNWSRPLYFTIPAALWRESGNTLQIRLGSYYGYGLLGQAIIGPDAVLKKEYQRQLFWRTGVADALFMVLIAITLFMLTIWRRRRNDAIYLWFAVTTLLWSFLALNISIRVIPVPEKIWDTFIYSAIAWWTVSIAIFSHRFANIVRPRLERAYLLWATVVTLAYSASTLEALPTTSLYCQLGSPLIGFVTLWLLISAWRRHHNREVAALAVGIALVQLAGIYNFLTQSLLIPEHMRGAGQLIEVASPILLILIAWHLTGRFVNALNEAEALNSELESRVTAKHAELDESYTRLRELERQQTITQERERIHRDLHDDVGAKLLTLTYRSRDNDSAEIARSALQDLRDVVSHSASAALTLEHALANWRAECSDRLDDAGIALKWQQPDELPPHLLQPQQTMNIGRILREAISNAIRHAKANSVMVTIEQQGDAIHITIENDGIDCDLALWGRGRGTQNMKIRAGLLGGEIQWQQRQPKGSRIEWWFPLTLPGMPLAITAPGANTL